MWRNGRMGLGPLIRSGSDVGYLDFNLSNPRERQVRIFRGWSAQNAEMTLESAKCLSHFAGFHLYSGSLQVMA